MFSVILHFLFAVFVYFLFVNMKLCFCFSYTPQNHVFCFFHALHIRFFVLFVWVAFVIVRVCAIGAMLLFFNLHFIIIFMLFF